MKRGLALVEGQTEERFVNECLGPHLGERGLFVTPKIVTTKVVAAGPDFKGGVAKYEHVQRDLGRLLHDSNASVVTTLLDYYALPRSFPGMVNRPGGNARTRAAHVEHAWAAAIEDPRFLPNLALHELEAWVFAGAGTLEPWMFDDDASIVTAIEAIAGNYVTPEDINEGFETAPSRRLVHVFPAYQKTLHGPLAFAAIGIERIRASCPHFAAWLARLETIAAS